MSAANRQSICRRRTVFLKACKDRTLRPFTRRQSLSQVKFHVQIDVEGTIGEAPQPLDFYLNIEIG